MRGHHERVKSGITTVSSGVLCVLAAVHGGNTAPCLEVPPGFIASVYARDIDGASRLELRPDGTLTLQGHAEHFEIAPPTADAPVTVMRVATGLDAMDDATRTSLAVQAPRFVRMRWDARSGELAYVLARDTARRLPVPPQTLALARALARRDHGDVALAPDGTLFFADARAGAVWRIERAAL
jgi:hypothetical protein